MATTTKPQTLKAPDLKKIVGSVGHSPLSHAPHNAPDLQLRKAIEATQDFLEEVAKRINEMSQR